MIPEDQAAFKNAHAKIVVLVDDTQLLKESDDNDSAIDFSTLSITAFSGESGVEVQKGLRNEW